MRSALVAGFSALVASVAALVLAPAREVLAADMAVDLELVLAVDVSRSMDAGEQRVQREGYINGIRHPEVVAAIVSGPTGRIALTYLEWAGPSSQQVVVPWTLIDGADAAEGFARRIEPGLVLGRFGTSISSSLVFSASQFDGNGFAGARRVIDVSGDGPNNIGPPVVPARDSVLARGITINGLPIMLSRAIDAYGIGDLDAYYRDCVVGGAGAFTLAVTAADQFERAIRRKLIQEIAGRVPVGARVVLAAGEDEFATGSAGTDCLIGEKRRGRAPLLTPYGR